MLKIKHQSKNTARIKRHQDEYFLHSHFGKISFQELLAIFINYWWFLTYDIINCLRKYNYSSKCNQWFRWWNKLKYSFIYIKLHWKSKVMVLKSYRTTYLYWSNQPSNSMLTSIYIDCMILWLDKIETPELQRDGLYERNFKFYYWQYIQTWNKWN